MSLQHTEGMTVIMSDSTLKELHSKDKVKVLEDHKLHDGDCGGQWDKKRGRGGGGEV